MVDIFGRYVICALRHTSEPLKGIVKAATTVAFGLPDVPGAGESDTDYDTIFVGEVPTSGGPSA